MLPTFQRFPVQMNINKLKTLDIRYEFSGAPFLKWMAKQLRTLERLEFSYMEENKTDTILDFLRTLDPSFQSSLKTLEMDECGVNDAHLETLFFEIMPKFENLYDVDFSNNNIRSVRPIVDRIENDICFGDYLTKLQMSDFEVDGGSQLTRMLQSLPTFPSVHALVLYNNELNKTLQTVRGGEKIKFDKNRFISKSIRILGLCGNGDFHNAKEDLKEKAALLSLLKSVSNIYNLSGYGYDSDVEYMLRINHAGRRILEGSRSGGRSFPLSVWPTVLERAFNKSNNIYEYHSYSDQEAKDPTGLFYLLCNGPVLLGRTD